MSDWLRLHWKLFLRRFRCIDMFCKQCGRDCWDFAVPNDTWAQVAPHIQHGNVLCYDCFARLAHRLGIATHWRLEAPHA